MRHVHSRVMAEEIPEAAVVTGAASGMGEAVARRFLAEGWRVLAVDVDADGLARLAAASSDRVVPLTLDIRSRAAVDAALAAVPEAGQLRAVVNAAGIYPTSTLADYSDE